jgi:translation initiation factor 1
MNLQDQLKNLFPEHNFKASEEDVKKSIFQEDPLICKYEKRKGKPITIIEGFTNVNESKQKEIAQKLKRILSVGGSVKSGKIIIQGDNRDIIMNELKKTGFNVKRVGG